MRHLRLVQFVAVLLTGVQLVCAAANVPALVMCSGANGHQAIEMAHGPATCEAVTPHADSPESPASFHTDPSEPCKDVALGVEVVLRQEQASDLLIHALAAAPLLFEMPVQADQRLPQAWTSRISSSPDSAESLSRHVILLI